MGPRDPIIGAQGIPLLGPKGSHYSGHLKIPLIQGIGKDVGPRAQRTPENGKSRDVSPIASGYLWVISYNPQESLENTTNTMGITVRGIPNCPLKHGHEPIQRGPQMVENSCKFGWFLQMLFSQT